MQTGGSGIGLSHSKFADVALIGYAESTGCGLWRLERNSSRETYRNLALGDLIVLKSLTSPDASLLPVAGLKAHWSKAQTTKERDCSSNSG